MAGATVAKVPLTSCALAPSRFRLAAPAFDLGPATLRLEALRFFSFALRPYPSAHARLELATCADRLQAGAE